jgi:hypothetical protein
MFCFSFCFPSIQNITACARGGRVCGPAPDTTFVSESHYKICGRPDHSEPGPQPPRPCYHARPSNLAHEPTWQTRPSCFFDWKMVVNTPADQNFANRPTWPAFGPAIIRAMLTVREMSGTPKVRMSRRLRNAAVGRSVAKSERRGGFPLH